MIVHASYGRHQNNGVNPSKIKTILPTVYQNVLYLSCSAFTIIINQLNII